MEVWSLFVSLVFKLNDTGCRNKREPEIEGNWTRRKKKNDARRERKNINCSETKLRRPTVKINSVKYNDLNITCPYFPNVSSS